MKQEVPEPQAAAGDGGGGAAAQGHLQDPRCLSLRGAAGTHVLETLTLELAACTSST